jgi:hypothetical protein
MGEECEPEIWAQPACKQAVRVRKSENLRRKESPSQRDRQGMLVIRLREIVAL